MLSQFLSNVYLGIENPAVLLLSMVSDGMKYRLD